MWQLWFPSTASAHIFEVDSSCSTTISNFPKCKLNVFVFPSDIPWDSIIPQYDSDPPLPKLRYRQWLCFHLRPRFHFHLPFHPFCHRIFHSMCCHRSGVGGRYPILPFWRATSWKESGGTTIPIRGLGITLIPSYWKWSSICNSIAHL